MATRRKAGRGNGRKSSNKSSGGGGSSSIARTSSSGTARRNGRRGGKRKGGGSGGPSPKAVREKANWETLAYGAVAALGFGFAQSKFELPGIKGVPNSLTYGVGAVAAGVLMDSDVVMRIGSGPLMAGLHNLAIKGFKDAETVSGEFDSVEGEFDATEGEFDSDSVAGEFDSGDAVEGEFEDVAAGDFSDL